jgi:hypothetical protein
MVLLFKMARVKKIGSFRFHSVEDELQAIRSSYFTREATSTRSQKKSACTAVVNPWSACIEKQLTKNKKNRSQAATKTT